MSRVNIYEKNILIKKYGIDDKRIFVNDMR